MKIIIFVTFIAASTAYGMDKMWTDLVICSNKIQEQKQELEKLNGVKNKDDLQTTIIKRAIINKNINNLKLQQEIEHQRVIHRGLEPEPLKAKL